LPLLLSLFEVKVFPILYCSQTCSMHILPQRQLNIN